MLGKPAGRFDTVRLVCAFQPVSAKSRHYAPPSLRSGPPGDQAARCGSESSYGRQDALPARHGRLPRPRVRVGPRRQHRRASRQGRELPGPGRPHGRPTGAAPRHGVWKLPSYGHRSALPTGLGKPADRCSTSFHTHHSRESVLKKWTHTTRESKKCPLWKKADISTLVRQCTPTNASQKTTPEPLRVETALPLSPRRSFTSLLVARLRLTNNRTDRHYLYWLHRSPPERERLAP